MVNNMTFMHFTTFGEKKNSEQNNDFFIIHLQHSVFDAGIIEELETIISESLKNNSWLRTVLIPLSPIDPITGKAMTNVSADILVHMCNEIIMRLQGKNDE